MTDCIFLRHCIPLTRQQYVNKNATEIPVQRYRDVVIRNFVAKFAARLHKPNHDSGAFTKTSLLTRAWRHRSRPSWLSNMPAPICELAYMAGPHVHVALICCRVCHQWRSHPPYSTFAFKIHIFRYKKSTQYTSPKINWHGTGTPTKNGRHFTGIRNQYSLIKCCIFI